MARATGDWTLGEDSGLVVPALNGRPGVYSARYAGNRVRRRGQLALLAVAADRPPANDRGLNTRAAYYVCVAALSEPQGDSAGGHV